MNSNKLKLTFFLIVFAAITGCSDGKLIITSEFLRGNSKELNNFKVIQIFPQDSLRPPLKYTESTEFRYASIVDSSFKSSNKIFFNKSQQGLKWVSIPLSDTAWVPTYNKSNFDSIGKLKNDSWYLFKGLSNFGYLYFIYITNDGETKIYEVNKSNY